MGEKEYLMKGLKDFVKNLSEEIKINKVILFGSRATKEFRKDSDVDLMIVSENFKDMNFFERVKKMYDYWKLDFPVDFVCYTQEEFNELKKRITLVSIALKKGILIQNG